MSTDTFLSALRPWVWLLAAVTLAGGLLGYVATSQTAPQFQARATVLVGPALGEVDVLRAATEATATYAELAVSDPALQAVSDVLGLSVDVLEEVVTVTPNSETRLIEIVVRSDSPLAAATIADAVAAQLVRQSSEGAPGAVGQLRIVAPASQTPDQLPRNAVLFAGLAGLVALVGSSCLVLLFERSRHTVRSRGELAELSRLPVLATVPAALVGGGRGGAVVRAGAEMGYRLLATHLSFRGAAGVQVVAVVGVREDDASYHGVAANLALALAASGSRVLVTDVGESVNDSSLARQTLIVEPGAHGPRVTGSGWKSDVRRPRTATASSTAKHLMALRQDVDVVVLTPSPISGSPATINWVAASDVVLLVVQSRGADAYQVATAAETVRLTDPQLAGLVLIPTSRRSRHGAVLQPGSAPEATSSNDEAGRPFRRLRAATSWGGQQPTSTPPEGTSAAKASTRTPPPADAEVERGSRRVRR